jgi:DNA-binding SARP family transcriptional activator
MSHRKKRSCHSLQLLGRFAAWTDDHRLLLRPTTQRLVALLAVEGALPRSKAAGLLWGDLPEGRALGSLRTVLWRARQDCPGLVSEEGGNLHVSDVQVDLVDVRAWAWRALRAEDPWMPLPQGAALELLPGWADDWLVEMREELRLLQLYAFETSAQRLLLGGRCGEAAGLALNALNLDPMRESANRILIEIHLRDGNRLHALRQFRKYEQLLRRELDIEPGPTLTALVGPLFPPRATLTTLVNK